MMPRLKPPLTDEERKERTAVSPQAAQSTVEALMIEFRTYGVGRLENPSTQRRLADLSARQVQQIIERLNKLRPRYPNISDELIEILREQKI